MPVGVNKKTGKLKKGYRYSKGGKVVKAKKVSKGSKGKKVQRGGSFLGGGILKKTKKIGRFTVSSIRKGNKGISFDEKVKVITIPENDCPTMNRVRQKRTIDGSRIWGCTYDWQEFRTPNGHRCCSRMPKHYPPRVKRSTLKNPSKLKR